MKKQIVAGNWKMNTDLKEARKLASEIVNGISRPDCEAIIAPPFPFLHTVSDVVKNTPVRLAAQNCNPNEAGAFTGEVSLNMLKSVGVEYVILGHSERREYFEESDELIGTKVDKAIESGLTPIFCCGEPLQVREQNQYVDFICDQIEKSLFFLSAEEFSNVVIAYEPIWAIGTGKTASATQAQEVHEEIRNFISHQYGKEMASELTILYGGSCKPANARELFAQPDVDGGLIGGASLKAEDFITITQSFS